MLAGDAQALAAMQGDYGYGPLVLAVGEAGKGEFVTRLAGTDSVGAINFGRSDKLSADAQSLAREAAATAFGIIENRWKVSPSSRGARRPRSNMKQGTAAPTPEPRRPLPRAKCPRNVVAQVEFSGLKDWQDIRGG